MIVAAMLMGVLGVYAFLHRKERGVRYFVWVMLCRVVYAGAVILELNSQSLEIKLLFRNVQNTSLILTVPFMVFCVLDLLGHERWLQRRRRLGMLAVFFAWVLLVWTDPFTGWINASVLLAGDQLLVRKTLLAIGLNVAAYSVLAICAFLLAQYLRRARPEVRKPGTWLVVFGCISFAAEIIKAAHADLSAWLLPFSVYSGCAAAFMLMIIIRNRFFSIVPLARNVVVESMEDGVLIVNEQGRIVDSNRLTDELLRRRPDESLIGKEARKLLASWPEWLVACLEHSSRSMEIVSSKGGQLRTFMVKVYPLSDTRKLGTVSLLIDISEKQRDMEQIAQLNRIKDQLFTVVSHDIRDPLAVQYSLIEELEIRRKELDEEQQEIVAALGEQIRNSYLMVENLLEWFRGQKEGLVLRMEQLELSELLEEAVRPLKVKSEEKAIRLEVDIPEGLYVETDRESTQLVLRNLLSNAIKFSRRGGLVSVSARLQEGQEEVCIAVRDSGIGMGAEQLRALFEQGSFASSVGTEGEKGTGLGLMVSRQFVTLAGGRLWAESWPGAGSVFYLTVRVG